MLWWGSKFLEVCLSQVNSATAGPWHGEPGSQGQALCAHLVKTEVPPPDTRARTVSARYPSRPAAASARRPSRGPPAFAPRGSPHPLRGPRGRPPGPGSDGGGEALPGVWAAGARGPTRASSPASLRGPQSSDRPRSSYLARPLGRQRLPPTRSLARPPAR